MNKKHAALTPEPCRPLLLQRKRSRPARPRLRNRPEIEHRWLYARSCMPNN